MTSASVEVVQSADRRRGVATLTLAFAAGPIMRWAWPDAYQYATYWPRIAEAYGGRAFDYGMLRVTQDEHDGDIHGKHVEPDIPGA